MSTLICQFFKTCYLAPISHKVGKGIKMKSKRLEDEL